MERMKRGKKHLSHNKFYNPNNKVYNKDFDKSNIKRYIFNKKGHYARECQENKRRKFKGIFHAFTAKEDEPTQKNSSNEEDDDR